MPSCVMQSPLAHRGCLAWSKNVEQAVSLFPNGHECRYTLPSLGSTLERLELHSTPERGTSFLIYLEKHL